jgi:hypothetical protein
MPRKGSRRLTAKSKKSKTEPSEWVKHVRRCMTKRNLTYRQATLDTECRREYYSKTKK